MWIILIWLAVGAVVGVAAFVAFFLVVDHYDTAQARKREQVRATQREAEHRLQQITQEALQRMLDIARSRL